MGKLIVLAEKRRKKRIRRFIRRKLLPSCLILSILGLQIYLVLHLKGML